MKRNVIRLLLILLVQSLWASDSLWVKRFFPFGDVGEAVSCFYLPSTNELDLGGFDTDGRGRFYFAGGRPLNVVCFRDGKMIYKRTLNEIRYAELRLMEDSVSLISFRSRVVIKMRADGKGALIKAHLNEGKIYDWAYRDSVFVVAYRKRESSPNQTILTYDYHGNLLNRDTTIVNDSEFGHIIRHGEYPVDLSIYARYVGRYKDFRLYLRLGEETCLTLVSADGRVKKKVQIDPEIIPLEPVFGSYSFEIVRNERFFTVGFDGNRRQIIVLEIDLKKAFGDMK